MEIVPGINHGKYPPMKQGCSFKETHGLIELLSESLSRNNLLAYIAGCNLEVAQNPMTCRLDLGHAETGGLGQPWRGCGLTVRSSESAKNESLQECL